MHSRLVRAILFPYRLLVARVFPVSYARMVGVKMTGRVHIYGSSYGMFSTEPWLITLGDNVFITTGVSFITHDGGTLILRQEVPDLELTAPINIGNNVYIGIRSIILPGVTIGNRCIIGAGSVVAHDIPGNSVAAGVPARVIKTVDEYLEKAKAHSLHLGHLSAADKARALKKVFGTDARENL